MFRYCGIDFIEGPSGLWVPCVADPFFEKYGVEFDPALHGPEMWVSLREAHPTSNSALEPRSRAGGRNYGPSNKHPWFTDDDPADSPEIQQHIEEHRHYPKNHTRYIHGPLSDSTIEDFLR